MSDPLPAAAPADAGGDAPAGQRRGRPSGWWYLLAPAALALGALLAGTVVLLALSAAGRSVTDEPTIPVADTAVVEVTSPGEFVVFARYRTSVGGQPVDEPLVVVLDPDGGALTLDGPDPTQSWTDGDGELVAIGNVTTTSGGSHRVVVGPVATDLVAGVVVAPDPLVGVVSALGWALGLVVLSAVGAVVAIVVVALRRRRPGSPRAPGGHGAHGAEGGEGAERAEGAVDGEVGGAMGGAGGEGPETDDAAQGVAPS